MSPTMSAFTTRPSGRTLYTTTQQLAAKNTALGWDTLYSNTTGTSNVAIGMDDLYSNTTGGTNVAIGLWTSL